MTRSTLFLLFALPGVLCAGLFPSRPVDPAVVKDIAAYSNGIYVDLRVPRAAFSKFLARARYSAALPPEVIKRRDRNDLGWFTADDKKGKTEIFLRVEGVFSDDQGHVFFWELPDPRVLVFSSENGDGGYFWVSEDETEIHTEFPAAKSSSMQNTPNQALLPTPTAVTPPASHESRQP